MKHQLEFEKPIFEIQAKLEELRKSTAAGVDLEAEIRQMACTNPCALLGVD